ncbi:MAG: response regulator transcription factor [Clostridia bacterium]
MIYCVEDDKNIRELIVYTLKTIGFNGVGFCDAKEFFKELETNIPRLILLDIMLPETDGLQILQTLKSDSRTRDIPVIMVTARGSEFDKVSGLDLGADDYIAKPFGMMEMVSRIKAVLRRTEKETSNKDIITCKNIMLDKKKYSVYVNNQEVTLSFKEYELLKMLMENMGLVLTRDQLLNKIWGYDYDGENRTVDVHIRTLRLKLGNGADIIQTIRNVGYKIGD